MLLCKYARKTGLCLVFFVVGCSEPTFRLVGTAPGPIEQVALLDSSAIGVVQQAHAQFRDRLSELSELQSGALDSLSNRAESLKGPIAAAQRRFREAQNKYRQAFAGLQRYRSFGGNPVFTEEDMDVRPEKMLSEIADRFYNGRAFSLEVESRMRVYIRETLVPLNRDVRVLRARVRQLQRSQSGSKEARDEVLAAFSQRREALVEQTNEHILDKVSQRLLDEAKVDSTGTFAFHPVKKGRYCLYAPHPLPKAYLILLNVQQHTYQDLAASANVNLLVSEEDASDG